MKKLFLTLSLVLFIGTQTVSAQCPMCKTALKSNKEGGQKVTVGNGINKGILFLLAMPYVLAGTAGLVFYNNRRKNRNA